jgi:hypothetical protein
MSLSIRKRFAALLVVAAVVAVGSMAVTQSATATHARVKAATPMYVPMVLAYKDCDPPNEVHGGPLSVVSCNPPIPASNFVTIGTPDANGAGANGTGFIKLRAIVGVPGGPDDTDMAITANATDVRCKGASVTCGSTNAAAGADYTGQLQLRLPIRMTDHDNGLSGTAPGTTQTVGLPVVMTCAATASTIIGGTCDVNTSADSVVPGMVKEGKRTQISGEPIPGVDVSLEQIPGGIIDAGSDGNAGTTGDGEALFMEPGLFFP